MVKARSTPLPPFWSFLLLCLELESKGRVSQLVRGGGGAGPAVTLTKMDLANINIEAAGKDQIVWCCAVKIQWNAAVLT